MHESLAAAQPPLLVHEHGAPFVGLVLTCGRVEHDSLHLIEAGIIPSGKMQCCDPADMSEKLDTVKVDTVSLPIALGLWLMMWPVLTKVHSSEGAACQAVPVQCL